MHHPGILATIGNTPTIELRNLGQPDGVRIFAKLEGQNPSGSIKDRVVEHMVRHAEREGRLRPGDTIVEATTGNTGIALAMVGRLRGYQTCLVVPMNAAPTIRRILAAYGAQVIHTPAEGGVEAAIAKARELAAQRNALLLNQFESPANVAAHYDHTGAEILAAVPEVDVLVAGLGTGGTLMGAGRRLKEARRDIKVVAVEPHPGSQVQGLRSLAAGYIPPILDLDMLDGKILVRGADAFRTARLLLDREGIFGGVSAGAVLHGALRWARRMRTGTIVVILADGGWKYVGSSLWEREHHHADESLDDVLWW